jgi:hypothetical protein
MKYSLRILSVAALMAMSYGGFSLLHPTVARAYSCCDDTCTLDPDDPNHQQCCFADEICNPDNNIYGICEPANQECG